MDNEPIRVGAKLRFAEERAWYTVRAMSGRYAVCTRPRKQGSVWYTVVDIEEQVRGPENLVLGMGAETDSQCEQMIDRLEGRCDGIQKTEVSRRNRVPLFIQEVKQQQLA